MAPRRSGGVSWTTQRRVGSRRRQHLFARPAVGRGSKNGLVVLDSSGAMVGWGWRRGLAELTGVGTGLAFDPDAEHAPPCPPHASPSPLNLHPRAPARGACVSLGVAKTSFQPMRAEPFPVTVYSYGNDSFPIEGYRRAPVTRAPEMAGEPSPGPRRSPRVRRARERARATPPRPRRARPERGGAPSFEKTHNRQDRGADPNSSFVPSWLRRARRRARRPAKSPAKSPRRAPPHRRRRSGARDRSPVSVAAPRWPRLRSRTSAPLRWAGRTRRRWARRRRWCQSA